MNNLYLQAIGIDAGAFERASEAQVIGWAENNTTAGFGLCEAALVWLKARYKRVSFVSLFSDSLDSIDEEHEIIRDGFVYRLRPGYQPDRFWLCQASNTVYTSPNALDSSGTPDIEITERYAKYVNNPPPGACELRTPEPGDAFFDLLASKWEECEIRLTARGKTPAFRWCKIKTRWWFNTATKAVFTCSNGRDQSDKVGIVREISEAYAKYLTSKPEGNWELRRFKKGDVLLTYGTVRQHTVRAEIASTANRFDDLGYRWCTPGQPWHTYDVVVEAGQYVVHMPGGVWTLDNAANCVGCGGVQFAGQREDAWHMNTRLYIDKRGTLTTWALTGTSATPAVPVRIRFYKEDNADN